MPASCMCTAMRTRSDVDGTRCPAGGSARAARAAVGRVRPPRDMCLLLLLLTAAAAAAAPAPAPQYTTPLYGQVVTRLVHRTYEPTQVYAPWHQYNLRVNKHVGTYPEMMYRSDRVVKTNLNMNNRANERRRDPEIIINAKQENADINIINRNDNRKNVEHKNQQNCNNVMLITEGNGGSVVCKNSADNEVQSVSPMTNRSQEKFLANGGGKESEEDRWVWEYGVTSTSEVPPSTVDLNDRSAFDGNKCPTGQVRVNGICVEKD